MVSIDTQLLINHVLIKTLDSIDFVFLESTFKVILKSSEDDTSTSESPIVNSMLHDHMFMVFKANCLSPFLECLSNPSEEKSFAGLIHTLAAHFTNTLISFVSLLDLSV